MNAFLIGHGEKIALALAAVLCVWALYSTITDPATKAEATPTDVQKLFMEIDKAAADPGRPNLAPTRDFLSIMRTRFATAVEPTPVMAYLHEHPDLDPLVSEAPAELYVYEIGRPEARAEDRIGSVEITVRLPLAPRPDEQDHRIKDDPAGVSWTRAVRGAENIVNSAEVVGVLIEHQVGEDPSAAWEPLATAQAPDGVVAYSPGKDRLTLTLADPVEWQQYAFRARLIAEATGVGPGEQPSSGNPRREVLVVSGRIDGVADDAIPTDYNDALFKAQVRDPFQAGNLPVAEPYTGTPRQLPPVEPGRRRFLGAPGQEARLRVSGTTRIALVNVSGGLGGIEPTARVLVTKLIKDPATGKAHGWTEPFEYKVGVGEPIGKTELIPTPPDGDNLPIDLSTPFVVKELKKGVERIYFWEIDKTSMQRQNANGALEVTRGLGVEPKARNTDVALLHDPQTGTELTLVELSNIPPPRAPFTYPPVPEQRSELQLFKERPGEFRTAELKPEKPAFSEDRDLLRRHLPAIKKGLADWIALPFVVTPDDRIVYYFEEENKVDQIVIPDGRYDRRARGLAPVEERPAAGPGIARPPAGAAQLPVAP